jgi:hypothetical protein
MKFKIEGIFKITNRRYFVAIECLEKSYDYRLTENSKLGNVEITITRIFNKPMDKSGNIRINCFTFQLKNEADFDKLKVDKIVDLINEL